MASELIYLKFKLALHSLAQQGVRLMENNLTREQFEEISNEIDLMYTEQKDERN